ncbi:uncharacterized protein N7515_007784 [Penicillium bovifimosum]|uniref:Uncharacterized protein n=1 Tax=Penicillium bovifimosum TaxID=126998 RepID=A0A9W9GM73_9EURO|nr:uncharacterized protein N7515_007784 [Penicillium bovifimosum]KAJ5123959.1 hypothetical protein N7515_007784 [Penicillium bovifimosum]
MIQFNPSTLTVLLALFLSHAVADDAKLSSNLVGCNEVSCPKEGADDRCTVGNNTFMGIGLSHLADAPSYLSDFALLKGVNVSAPLGGKNNDKPRRPFRSFYYLGAPSDAEAKDLSGCVVVFHDPPSKKFKGPKLQGKHNGTDTRAASGTCSDVIDKKCIKMITDRATELADQANGEVCEELNREFKKNLPDECDGFGGNGRSFGEFSVKSLGNLTSIPNSTDCWPVMPKSDQLLGIMSSTYLRNYSADALIDEAYKITPILTVFVGKDNSSFVNETSSQMTCLKVVTEDNPDDDKDSDKSSALRMKASGLVGGIAVLVAGIFAIL